jgi:hypothetical protein
MGRAQACKTRVAIQHSVKGIVLQRTGSVTPACTDRSLPDGLW